MIMRPSSVNCPRPAADAGIAIGPILFIISVLGILAAAIAAGSGSFTTGTATESNRAKSAAIIDIGQNLKIGFDRIIGTGVDFDDVVINPNNTSSSFDLFSPLGGGIAAPSVTMAADPANDKWYYPLIEIPKLGTSNGCRTAVLRVTKGVCDDINSKVAALSAGAVDTAVNLGNFGGDQATVINATLWPADLQGKPTGCVNNSDATVAAAGYYFYQVLGIQ